MSPQPPRPSTSWRTPWRPAALAWCLTLAVPSSLAAAAEPPDRAGGGAEAVCEELPAVQAAPARDPAAAAETAMDSAVVVLPGQRAFIDPATGRPLTPPPAERRTLTLDPALERALSTSAAGLAEERLPDGTHVLRLQGRFLSPLFGVLVDDDDSDTGEGGGAPRIVTGHGWAPAETPSPAPPEPTAPGGVEGGDDEAP